MHVCTYSEEKKSFPFHKNAHALTFIPFLLYYHSPHILQHVRTNLSMYSPSKIRLHQPICVMHTSLQFIQQQTMYIYIDTTILLHCTTSYLEMY